MYIDEDMCPAGSTPIPLNWQLALIDSDRNRPFVLNQAAFAFAAIDN